MRFSFKLIILLRRIKQGEKWLLYDLLSAIASLIWHGPVVPDAPLVFDQGVAQESTLASLHRHILAINLNEVADGGTFGLLVIHSSNSWMDVLCWDLLNQLTLLISADHISM